MALKWFSGVIKIKNKLFDEWSIVGRMGMTQPFIGCALNFNNTVSLTAWLLNLKFGNAMCCFRVYIYVSFYVFKMYVDECHFMVHIMGFLQWVVNFKYGVCAFNFIVKF